MDLAQFEAIYPLFLLRLDWLLSDYFLVIERHFVFIFEYALFRSWL